MAYTKQTWSDGAEGNTPITAERLNHMEAGIEAANKVATETSDGIMSAQDKTYLEDLKDCMYDSGWVTLYSSGDNSATGDFVIARKKNGFVSIIGQSYGAKLLNQNAYTIVANLPDDMIPEYTAGFVFHAIGSNANGQSSFVVGRKCGSSETPGDIKLHTTSSGITYWSFHITYMI